MIDLRFIIDNYSVVVIWVGFILFVNTLIHAGILVLLSNSWKESIQVAAILAQAGEFGFLLVAIGFSKGILQLYDYNLAVSVIALTLLLSPFWVGLMKKLLSIDKKYIEDLHKRYLSQLKIKE